MRSLQDAAPSSAPPPAQPDDDALGRYRMLSAAPSQWENWQRKAASTGLSWSDWLRRLQDAAP